jgi:hypothetical protein
VGELVKAKGSAGFAELGADEVPTGVRDVGVFDAEDDGHLGTETGEKVNSVVAVRRRGSVVGVRSVGMGAERAGVYVRGEVGDTGGYAAIELCTMMAISTVSTE